MKPTRYLPINFSLDFIPGDEGIVLDMYMTDANRKSFKPTVGLYVIFNNANEIIYVGESVNIRNRLSFHFTQSKFRREIYRIGVYYGNFAKYERVALEAMLILQYDPEYNDGLVGRKPKMVS